MLKGDTTLGDPPIRWNQERERNRNRSGEIRSCSEKEGKEKDRKGVSDKWQFTICLCYILIMI